jgi:hypothetical protein
VEKSKRVARLREKGYLQSVLVEKHQLTTEIKGEGVKENILKCILKKQGVSLHSGFFALGRVQWWKFLSTMMNLYV